MKVSGHKPLLSFVSYIVYSWNYICKTESPQWIHWCIDKQIFMGINGLMLVIHSRSSRESNSLGNDAMVTCPPTRTLTHWCLGELKENSYVIFKIILVIGGRGNSCVIDLKWMSLGTGLDKSTLVQLMAWCRQATSHYLNQCWHRSMSPYGITRPQWFNS